MPTVKYTAQSLMLWAYFSAGGPGHLVQIHGIMWHHGTRLPLKSYNGSWLELLSGQ